jgi:hypothetical protein
MSRTNYIGSLGGCSQSLKEPITEVSRLSQVKTVIIKITSDQGKTSGCY